MKLNYYKLISILLLSIISITLHAQNRGFEIMMNIKGADSAKLYHTFFGDKNAGTGEFAFKESGEVFFRGEINSPVMVRISFSGIEALKKSPDGRGYYPMKSSNLWFILHPGDKFAISGDITGKDFVDIYPDNNEENRYLAELNGKIMPLINESGNIMLEIARNKEMDENRKLALRNRSMEIAGSIQDAKLNFLATRQNSIAALWLMEDMLVRSELGVSEMAKCFETVNPIKFEGHYFYEAVKNRVESVNNVAIGKASPEISTNASLDGTVVSLSDLKGKFVIIDFWGTWCGPCLAGVPHMKAFRDKYSDKLEIFGVSNDKKADVWKSVIEKYQMNWPNIMIGTGDKDYVAKFNVQGFPTKILVSPEGIILYRETGENESFYIKAEEFITGNKVVE